jgi:hypothetical protein
MKRGVAYFGYRVLFIILMAVLCTPAVAGTTGKTPDRPFLLTSISNHQPYVGQEALLTYTLYFRDAAPKIINEENPPFRGIWARESGPERYIRSIPVTIKGEQFRSAVVKQFRLAPMQNGTITISGYSMLCTLPQEQPSDGKNNLSDTRLQLTAPDITISARELPKPVPAGFSGAVGTFHIDLLADKESLKVGEPLSLKLTVTGTGNLHALKLPDIHLPESFRQNPPDIATTLTKESEKTTGSVTSTVIAWPQSEGEYEIPAVETSVFNPETGNFSTLFTKALTMKVAAAAPTKVFKESVPGSFSDSVDNLPASMLFKATVTVSLLLGGAALIIIWKKRRQQHIQTATASAAEHGRDKGKSAGILKQELFSMLEERGIKSPGGLTRKELNIALQENGIPDEVRREIPLVLDALDRVLYAPSANKETLVPERIAAKSDTLMKKIKSIGSVTQK